MEEIKTRGKRRSAMYMRLGRKEECKNVAIYARRASMDRQGVNPRTAQIDGLKGIIHKQPGWKCAGVYSDDGCSGNEASRPAFQRMLSDCRAGRIDLILASSVDSFSRDPNLLLTTMKQLRRAGIDVFFEDVGNPFQSFPLLLGSNLGSTIKETK